MTMKKFCLLLLTMFLSLAVVFAQPKKVGYFTLQKTMDATAASVQIDPIIRMLQADPNLDVTVNVCTGKDTLDLSPYDVIVVQESFNSKDSTLTPRWSLALHSLTVPVVYNKTYAMAAGRAFLSGTPGGGAETEGTATESYVYLKVDPANQSNDLFKGITFVGDTVAIFKTPANDLGVTVHPDRFKALNYAKNAFIIDPGTGDTIKTTLLGKPAIIKAADAPTVTVSVNDIPAGMKIGSELLQARMITLGMNFGAICGAYGSNLTAAGLTLWRNAVYIAAGLTVPAEPAEFQKWQIGYYSLKGKTMVASAAQVDNDPIYTMLSTDNDQWQVNLNLVAADSVFDVNAQGYDAVIVEESFSGSSATFKPGGSLALAKYKMPVIFNKNYAFAGDRGFVVGTSGSGAELEGQLKLKVLPEVQTNPLFNGITFAEDSTTALVKVGAADDGGTSRTKAMNYAINVKLTDTLGTRLALPVGAPANATIGTVSDLNPGDSVGSEKLQARMIVIGMNFGAICRDRGTNMTSAGLTLWRNAVHSALGLSVPTTEVPQVIPNVKVILVTDDQYDDIQLKFLQNNSLNAEKLILPAGKKLRMVAQDTIDMLEAADVVIIGRSNNSGDFGSSDSLTRVTWNNLKVPIILNSQWIARNSRLNWFPSGSSVQVNDPGIFQGTILNTADPIFEYSTYDADGVSDWTYRADDYISVTAPFNGDTLVDREGVPLVVRFMQDSAFYPGALDTVRAPRTYFGFGNDNAGPYNYFNLTASAQAAYYGEIMRITGHTVIEPIFYTSADASMKLIISDQPFEPAFSSDVLAYTMMIDENDGIDSVQFTATANAKTAVVTGPSVVYLTQDTTMVSFFATAENLLKGPVYKFTIIVVRHVEPGFEDLTESGISLFPNPASENLVIDGLKGTSSIRIMNTVGQLVYSNEIIGSKDVINIHSFQNGIYIVRIEMNGKTVTTKFVKQ
jgi:hypothetical protein